MAIVQHLFSRHVILRRQLIFLLRPAHHDLERIIRKAAGHRRQVTDVAVDDSEQRADRNRGSGLQDRGSPR